ncbi:MAG: hypothetical protein ACI86H_002232 [bacterium]|jgi:hypothetical protein
MLRFVFFFLVLFGSISTCIAQMRTDFLPKDVIRTTHGFQYNIASTAVSNNNSSFSPNDFSVSRHERPLIEKYLEDFGLLANDFTGSIKEITTQYDILIEYGLSTNWSFGFYIPYLWKERQSELTDNNLGSSTATLKTSFESTYASDKQSGLGDVELWLTQKLSYSDESSFQWAFGVKANTGKTFYDDTGKLHLGQGESSALVAFRWRNYSRYSRINSNFELFYNRPLGATVTDSSGDSVTLAHAAFFQAKLGIENTGKTSNFGLNLIFQRQGEGTLGETKLADNYSQVGYEFFFGFGNLHLLEQKVIDTPFHISFHIEDVISGDDVKRNTTFKMNFMLYL